MTEVTNYTGDMGKFIRRVYAGGILGEPSVDAEYRDLLLFKKELAEMLITNPGGFFEHANDAVHSFAVWDKATPQPPFRVHGLVVKTPIRGVRTARLGNFVALEGIVRVASDVRPHVTRTAWQCTRQHITRMTQPLNEKLVRPGWCVDCEGPFRGHMLERRSEKVDFQFVTIQEFPESLHNGEQPVSIDCVVTADLAGRLQAGDRVVINGTVRTKLKSKTDAVLDIYIEVNSYETMQASYNEIVITDKDMEAIEELAAAPDRTERIVSSIAPSIYGHTAVKEAIALQLFGGVPKDHPDGTRLRGDSHILLLGDPGIAKSQLLVYVIRLSPRGIYVSGKGASTAGLTATVARDEVTGHYTVEAGALVLANNGMCAVDEVEKMNPADQESLHTAMEQQFVSINKASVHATLPTKCSLLAAANPKLGRFDPMEDFSSQIDLPPTLLSRFDLVFILRDVPNEEKDGSIADHILGMQMADYAADAKTVEDAARFVAVKPDLLRKYIAYARQTCFPVLTPEAAAVIRDFYMGMRLSSAGRTVPVTARQLEGLVRLAESSAKMRLSATVDAPDAERAVRIATKCLYETAYDPKTKTFDVDRRQGSASQLTRNAVKAVTGILRDIDPENRGVPEKAVRNGLLAQGYPLEDVEPFIEKACRASEVMRPRNGVLKLV